MTTHTPKTNVTTPAISTTQATQQGSIPSTLHDIIVIGAGPAGLSLAAALANRNLSVCCIDATFNRPWPNHYGVWRDEFEAVGFEECATDTYDVTTVLVGSSSRDVIKVNRPYIRVDRVKLKAQLTEQCKQKGVAFHERFVRSVEHVSSQWSIVNLQPVSSFSSEIANDDQDPGPETADALRGRLIVDCTGHAIAFTNPDEARSRGLQTWYQAAYGIEAEVKSYPYAKDEMLLMDFRNDHASSAEERRESERKPTFLYVFPGGEKRAFFEETSVIQKEAVSFEELKERLYRRLQHDGVEVTRVIEEEKSFIPLGGLLPDLNQRVVAFGGAALLVHPATGYMVGRVVNLAERLADRVKEELDCIGATGDVSKVSRACWNELWGVKVRRQRDFLVYGAELLESLDMEESRAFFHAFFQLPWDLWEKFLGQQLDAPFLRAQFALMFFVVANNSMRIRLLSSMVDIGKWRMIRSVLPEWLTAHQD